MNKQTECKIVLDLETTGIPKRVSGFYSNPSDLSLYDSARIFDIILSILFSKFFIVIFIINIFI